MKQTLPLKKPAICLHEHRLDDRPYRAFVVIPNVASAVVSIESA